jgi:hypothetical protein
MAALSRDILLTCIRNTQLQEESARKNNAARKNTDITPQVPSQPPPRRSSRAGSIDASVVSVA